MKAELITVHIPDGYKIESVSCGELNKYNFMGLKIHLEKLKPEIEVETSCFSHPRSCFNVSEIGEKQEIDIAKRFKLNNAEVRDLIKFLNYWLAYNVLPDQESIKIVKEIENGNDYDIL